MRHKSKITSLSWIPSEAVEGIMRIPFDAGIAHYDPPPPEKINDLKALRGERAHLEGELRTSTLGAVTPCRVASVKAEQLERGTLTELSKGHRREGKRPKKSARD
ncbi:MAG TPA: hypothetical protein VIJ39_04285 [Solirubrobacteraceae bacterium]